jgi:nucleotide-binding universal stress UspA family protein
MSAPVLVGVDGSAAALSAVDLAADEAALRKRPLHIVYVCQWPSLRFAMGSLPDDLRNEGDQILGAAGIRARRRAPAVPVSTSVAAGDAAGVLTDEADHASLVVVGSRERLGSVAFKVAAHSSVPVLVARGVPAAAGGVVLGVDGSPANQPAVDFAFEEAARRRALLVAVHACSHPVSQAALIVEDETRVLFEALAGWQEKYPDVNVRPVLDRTSPRRALSVRAERAQLVVLGQHGHGRRGLTGFGSVTSALLHQAGCPVAVVPGR